jgi:hypothetical protein
VFRAIGIEPLLGCDHQQAAVDRSFSFDAAIWRRAGTCIRSDIHIRVALALFDR